MKIGAWYNHRCCDFTVWAPEKNRMEIDILSPKQKRISLVKGEKGYWHGHAENIEPFSTYYCVIDGKCSRPDPASFSQPEGVHAPSSIVDHRAFCWDDKNWKGIPLREMIQYEIHVGTFTNEGTFNALSDKLEYLNKLGINTIEIMPVSQFPGGRNWGYDGVFPYAVQNSYGGPHGLKQLVNNCHKHNIAVILDVVYNHLGPEGNYLGEFGPYFTHKYQTPWGLAINYDDAFSDGVRNFFIQNVLYWFEFFHIDGLRLDAIHGIYDFSAKHVLEEMVQKVKTYNKKNHTSHFLIAESDLNDCNIINENEQGGYGIHAQWLDDFHHSLRTTITNEHSGYYADFNAIESLAKAYQKGFVYDWKYSPHRKKIFGSSSQHIEPKQFVVFSQNHDQVGNRIMGERLTHLTDFESLKLTAGAIIFSPYIPLLFMGEEIAATSPFYYFISHGDSDLIEAVREGRKKEFATFHWTKDPPDPNSINTFNQCRMPWESLIKQRHKSMFAFYQTMIKIRKTSEIFRNISRKNIDVEWMREKRLIILQYQYHENYVWCFLNFNEITERYTLKHTSSQPFSLVLDSADGQWEGPGSIMNEHSQKISEIVMQPKSILLLKSEGL